MTAAALAAVWLAIPKGPGFAIPVPPDRTPDCDALGEKTPKPEWLPPALTKERGESASLRYRIDRGHGLGFRNRQGPDAEGWSHVELHPNYLHVGRSAYRLGRVDWNEVQRLANMAEGGGMLPEVSAVFEKCDGYSSPLRILTDAAGLHAAYAALLVDIIVRVRYKEVVVPEESRYGPDAKRSSIYCPRLGDAAAAESGPASVMRERKPDPGSQKRELALIHPEAVKSLKRKLKPHWPKAWAFAKRMTQGEVFPPVRVGWRKDTLDWRFKDGCHRFFGSHISGKLLLVSFKDPGLKASSTAPSDKHELAP